MPPLLVQFILHDATDRALLVLTSFRLFPIVRIMKFSGPTSQLRMSWSLTELATETATSQKLCQQSGGRMLGEISEVETVDVF